MATTSQVGRSDKTNGKGDVIFSVGRVHGSKTTKNPPDRLCGAAERHHGQEPGAESFEA